MRKVFLLALFAILAFNCFGITSMVKRLSNVDNIYVARDDGLLFTVDKGVQILMVPLNIVTYCDMMWIPDNYETYSSVVYQWKTLVSDRFPKVEREQVGDRFKFACIIMIVVSEEGKTYTLRWNDFVINGRTPVMVKKENYLRTNNPRTVYEDIISISYDHIGIDMIYFLYYDFLSTDDLKHPRIVFHNTYGDTGQIVWEKDAFESSVLMVQIYTNALEIYSYLQ
jgi:hypothetical protein